MHVESFEMYCLVMLISYCACATRVIYSCQIMRILTVCKKKIKLKEVKEKLMKMKNIILTVLISMTIQ